MLPYKLKKKGICDFYNDDKLFYPEFCDYSDWEVPYACPQPAGVYAYKGYAPSLKNWPITILNSGDYSAEATIEKDEVIYLRFRMYFSLINI